MCGSMLFAGNAGRCTSSSFVVRLKHMLCMHKRMLCAQCARVAAIDRLTGNLGPGCLAALAIAVQHSGKSQAVQGSMVLSYC